MAKAIHISEPNFPWAESHEDRLFKRMAIVMLLLFMSLGLVMNMLTLPEPEQRKLIDVSPRLAKLILEKKKEPPPPKKEIPKPEKKKVEKKPEAEKKKAEKKPEPKKKTEAREVAKQSGLIALQDELNDLRDFSLDDTLELPQETSGKKALEVASASELLTSNAKKSSGGITTSNLTRKVESTETASRKTTDVKSNIESTQDTQKKVAKSTGGLSTRSSKEITQVFDKNKTPIFAIYNRALRKDPSLQGKVVIELTIEPSGVVSDVKIVSSELADKSLERKLVLKIKKFKFTKANVARITVTYPIDFLPS